MGVWLGSNIRLGGDESEGADAGQEVVEAGLRAGGVGGVGYGGLLDYGCRVEEAELLRGACADLGACGRVGDDVSRRGVEVAVERQASALKRRKRRVICEPHLQRGRGAFEGGEEVGCSAELEKAKIKLVRCCYR